MGIDELTQKVRSEFAIAHKAIYGVGPGRVCTHIVKNIIVVKVTQCLTPLEKNLALSGKMTVVNEIRQKLLCRIKSSGQVEAQAGAILIDGVFHVHLEGDVVYGMLIFDKELFPE